MNGHRQLHDTNRTSNKQIKLYVALHLLMLLYSLSPICSKLAGQYPFLSMPFILFYGASIVILGIYALVWQQIIKRMSLSSAYANKAVTVVWGMVWGMIIFHERISVQKASGAVLIVAGVALYALSDKDKDRDKETSAKTDDEAGESI